MAEFHLEKSCVEWCLPVQERPVVESSCSWDVVAFSVSCGSLGIIAACPTRSLFSQPLSPGIGPPICSPDIHCSLGPKKAVHTDFQITLPFCRDLPWDPLPAGRIPPFSMTCPVCFL